MKNKELITYLPLIKPLFSFEKLLAKTNQKLFSPFYHLVSDKPVPHVAHLYRIKNVKSFKEDLDFLLKHFTPIDFFDLKKKIYENQLDKNYFFLSFDDGLSEIYHVVAPILKAKGIPATFFINTDFIDNKNLFYRYQISLIIDKIRTERINVSTQKAIIEIFEINNFPTKDLIKSLLLINYNSRNIINDIASLLQINFSYYLNKIKPYLTSEEIFSLINDGFTIGAHSLDHPMYSLIAEQEQVRQTTESIKIITNKFQLNYKTFSFPFTDFRLSKNFFNAVLDTKNGLVDLSFGSAGLKNDYLSSHIQRFPMEGTTRKASDLIYSEYLYYLLKDIFNKNSIIRK